MSSSGPSAANIWSCDGYRTEPGMCLERNPNSLAAITSLKASLRSSLARSSSRSMWWTGRAMAELSLPEGARAMGRQQAMFAVGLAGEADPAAVPDQLMREADPALLGDDLHQVLL